MDSSRSDNIEITIIKIPSKVFRAKFIIGRGALEHVRCGVGCGPAQGTGHHCSPTGDVGGSGGSGAGRSRSAGHRGRPGRVPSVRLGAQPCSREGAFLMLRRTLSLPQATATPHLQNWPTGLRTVAVPCSSLCLLQPRGSSRIQHSQPVPFP